jgi:hypothetical protein
MEKKNRRRRRKKKHAERIYTKLNNNYLKEEYNIHEYKRKLI